MKKVVIYGYYGQKNTGDDYIMLSVINSALKSRVCDIYVIVKEICFANYSFPKNVHFLALSRNKLIRQLQITFHACKCNIRKKQNLSFIRDTQKNFLTVLCPGSNPINFL